MSTANDHVHVVATLQALPDQIASLAALLGELARTSRQEAGNLRFDVHQQASNPSQLITIEHWDGSASVDAHMTSAHVGTVLARLAPLLAAPPQIVRYSQIA
ncbi:putative quinol monooxygenase [Nannocystis bainbridge]|uniref:Quinol monooxygenase n=1 Tax=Nannocystis bainbridge TaxID=2995303 RepID=A0ABT5EB85_9BACT|nr:putative quinol monooxygenase [Nannocystis bainbridge]MDC0723124.1 putative quinol monooxygenase [Nannocystis bainbridge]